MTGGRSDKDTVAQYSETGFEKYLAKLNKGRSMHACTQFVDESGKTVCFINNFQKVTIVTLLFYIVS